MGFNEFLEANGYTAVHSNHFEGKTVFALVFKSNNHWDKMKDKLESHLKVEGYKMNQVEIIPMEDGRIFGYSDTSMYKKVYHFNDIPSEMKDKLYELFSNVEEF